MRTASDYEDEFPEDTEAPATLSHRKGFPVFQIPSGTTSFGPEDVEAAMNQEDLDAAREFLDPEQR